MNEIPTKTKWIIAGSAAAAAVLIAVCLIVGRKPDSQAVVLQDGSLLAEVIFTEAQLEEIFEISELSTANYTYNSIVPAYHENGKTIRYYVSYEGTVKAGVDFSGIDIDIDNENKTISLTLPDAQIHEILVNAGTLDYIFTEKKYETETVVQEAYQLSCDDLRHKIENETQFYEMAKENAITAVEALIEPWVEQYDADYTVTVS